MSYFYLFYVIIHFISLAEQNKQFAVVFINQEIYQQIN